MADVEGYVDVDEVEVVRDRKGVPEGRQVMDHRSGRRAERRREQRRGGLESSSAAADLARVLGLVLTLRHTRAEEAEDDQG